MHVRTCLDSPNSQKIQSTLPQAAAIAPSSAGSITSNGAVHIYVVGGILGTDKLERAGRPYFPRCTPDRYIYSSTPTTII